MLSFVGKCQFACAQKKFAGRIGDAVRAAFSSYNFKFLYCDTPEVACGIRTGPGAFGVHSQETATPRFEAHVAEGRCRREHPDPGIGLPAATNAKWLDQAMCRATYERENVQG